MSDINNQQRHAQLQAQMTVCLNEMRAKVAGQMIGALERMEKRPKLKGDKSLPTIGGDPRLSKDESGSMIMGSVIGVPGMSSTMDAMIDVGVELYDSRKAAFARPQDNQKLSFKQMASIREQNKQDLGVYAMLGEKLNLLDTYISSGYSKAMIVEGTLLPLENGQEAKLELKDKYKADNQNYTLEEKYKPDNQNYKMAMPARKFVA